MSIRHGIRVRVPDEPCTLYMVNLRDTTYWCLVQYYFYWNREQGREARSHEVIYPMETMSQGTKKIENQSDLFHAFYEATLNPLLFTKGLYTVSDRPDYYGPLDTYTFVDGSSCSANRPILNERVFSSWGPRTAVVSVGTSSSRSSCYNASGEAVSHNSWVVDWGKPQVGSHEVIYFSTTIHYTYDSVDMGGGYDQYSQKAGIFSGTSKNVVVNAQPLCAVKPSDFDTTHFNFAYSLPPIPTVAHAVPANLTDRVYSQLSMPNVNNIENVAQFASIRRILPELRKAVKKRNLKSFASLYLFWKYEYSTTALDLKAYYAFFQQVAHSSKKERQMIRVSGPGSVPFSVTRHTISLPTFSASILETLGLTPNLANVWDCLPFTFILDWFINFGDIFQRLDQEKVISTLKIRYCTTSTSVNDSVVIENGPFEGISVDRSIYYRTCGDAIPTPDIDVAFKNPIRHLADGTALLVALHK